MTNSKLIPIIATGFVIHFICMNLTLLFFLFVVANPYNKESFDSIQWVNGNYLKRTRMVNSLLRNDSISSMNKQEISNTLGESITYIIDTSQTYAYPVGGAWFNFILRDDNFVLVYFTDEDLVESIQLGGW